MSERDRTKPLTHLAKEHNIGIDTFEQVVLAEYGRNGILHRNSINNWGAVSIDADKFYEGATDLSVRSTDVAEAIANSVSYTEAGKVDMRTKEYYNPSAGYFEGQAALLLRMLSDIETSQAVQELSQIESALVLGFLDNLRNSSQRTLYVQQREQKDTSRLETIVERIAESYYRCYIDGTLQGIDLLFELPELIKETDYSQTHLRELDNPSETCALALQILNPLSKRKKQFDAIINFPQGSMGLGRELNAVSQILRGYPFSQKVIDSHFSSYRNTGAFIDSLPPHQRKLFEEPLNSVLLADDNLVSGATLVYAKENVRSRHPEADIYCGAVEVYQEGIDHWKSGRYQFVTVAEIEDLLETVGVGKEYLPNLIGPVFNKRIYDTHNGLRPIRNDGTPFEGQLLEWKAMLSYDDIEAAEIPQELKNALASVFGFQPYSAVYEGTFSILDYHPIGELKIDDLPAYIATLK